MLEKKDFSSKDFHLTFAKPKVRMPEKIIHRNVEANEAHSSFSEERKHPVHFIDLPSKNISMTIGELLPNQITSKHRHTYETILYVIKGSGWTEIEDKKVEWKTGDAIYIPSWAWHRHGNKNNNLTAKYIACENAPQLQNLGLALREEEGRDI